MPLYVKRGDLHALGPDDVQRVETLDQLRRALRGFAERGVGQAYVQQEIEGRLVKFYGVSGGEYFTALPDGDELPERGSSRDRDRSLDRRLGDRAGGLGRRRGGRRRRRASG